MKFHLIVRQMDSSNGNGHASRHLLLAYTWSVNNIGDIAITPGFVSLLRQFQPDLPVQVLTSQVAEQPAFTYLRDYFQAHHHACTAVANPFRPLLGPPRFGDAVTAWGRFCTRWGRHKLEAFAKGCLATPVANALAADLLDRFTGEIIEELGEKNAAALAAFNQAGFLVYVSGTTLNFGRLQVRDFWNYTLLFTLPLLVARRLGLPYGVNAQSFDAIDWPGDLVLGPVLKEARFVFCRDSDSAAYLEQRSLHSAAAGFRPDSTFFFNVADEAWARQFMQQHSLPERGFLVLITRHSAPAADASTAWHQVGGDPTAGSVSLERQTEQMGKLRAFVEAWTTRTNLPVLMALETRAAREPMRKWLHRDLSAHAQSRTVWLEDFWTTEQAYSIYRHARIVVSMEMHSIIMAMQTHTPAIHIPFREAGRKSTMLADLGLGDWLLDIDEMRSTDLLDTALAIDRDFDASVARIQHSMTTVQQLGHDVIERVLQGWRE